MIDDSSLLRAFVDEHSDAAFRRLVEQRIDFVHAAALRQVGGDAHLAHEVAQNVFLDLARKARGLTARDNLAGWLFTSTRFAAAKALRSRSRRMKHETEAQAMHEILEASSAPGDDGAWRELRPVIDAALHELGEKDREAILLRFFENRSLAEVGAAIGLAENSARMRVDRALEKLRAPLSRRGITSTAAALGATLARQPVGAAPAGLASSVAGAALAGAAVAGGGAAAAAAWWIFHAMNTTKLTMGAAGLAAAVGLGAWLGSAYGQRPRASAHDADTDRPLAESAQPAALRSEIQRLQQALARNRPPRTATGGATMAAPAGANGLVESSTLSVLMDLRRRKLGNLEFEFVSEEARLQPSFAEVFGLQPGELENLQHAVDDARGRLAALTRENTSITRAPNGDVLVAIQPFPNTGGAVYDAMLKTFADTLGPERYTAFLALGAEQTEKKLGRFGTAAQTITLAREAGDDGAPRYRINNLTSNGPHDNSNYISDPLTAQRFAREIGPILELLPADFAPRK